MKWILWGLAAIAVLVVCASAYARLRPIPDAALARPEGDRSVGDHVTEGGIVAVRAPDDPAAAFEAVARVIADAPRTEIRAGGARQGTLTAVTRTRIMGFPDVSHAWIDGERLIVSGHLVIGRGDMGVNARRVRGWLSEAGL